MQKAKRPLIAAALFMMLLSAVLVLCTGGAFTSRPLAAQLVTEESQFSLELSYSENSAGGDTTHFLTAKVKASDAIIGSDYEYQYWFKVRVDTDFGETSLAQRQYIWSRESDYVGYDADGEEFEIANVDDYIDQNGNFNALVYIKETASGEIFALYSAVSKAEAGISVIEQVIIDGKAVEKEAIVQLGDSNLSVEVKAVNAAAYTVKMGNYTGSASSVQIPLSGFESGEYTLSVTAGGASKTIKVTLIGGFNASQTVIINSLTGKTTVEKTELTVNVQYADGTYVAAGDYAGINSALWFGGVKLTNPQTKLADDGSSMDIVFETTEVRYGIYYTYAEVYGLGSYGLQDKAILYHNINGGAARPVSLSQSAAGNPVAKDNAGVTVTATGTIGALEQSQIEYAFYREDAAGWVLIRGYEKGSVGGNVLNWKPQRAGSYNIQARIRATDLLGGSYEAADTVSYDISGGTLPAPITLSVYEYGKTTDILKVKAGELYTLSVDGGDDNALYHFVLYSKNLGTVYLNTYSPSNSLIFVPSRPDTYTVTARAINTSNFGYKDVVSNSKTVTSITGDLLSLDLDQTSLSLWKNEQSGAKNDTAQLTADVEYAGVDFAGAAVTWSSSDDTVATVVDGLVAAVKSGTATISVKAEYDTVQITKTTQVTVLIYGTPDYAYTNRANFNGLKATLRSDEELRYQDAISLKNLNAPFINLHITPENPVNDLLAAGNWTAKSGYEARYLYIKLTDKYDPANYVLFTASAGWAVHQGNTYLSAGAAEWLELDHGKPLPQTKGHIDGTVGGTLNTNFYGTQMRMSFGGYWLRTKGYIAPTGANLTHDINFYIENGIVSTYGSYSADGTATPKKFHVVDLSKGANFVFNETQYAWTGWSALNVNEEVYVSIWAGDYRPVADGGKGIFSFSIDSLAGAEVDVTKASIVKK